MEILSINVPLNQEHCSVLANYCKLRKLSLHGTTIPVQGLTTMLNEGSVRGKYIRCLSLVVDCSEQLKLICKHMICLQSFHCVVNDEAKKINLKSISWIGQLKNLKNLFLSVWSDQVRIEQYFFNQKIFNWLHEIEIKAKFNTKLSRTSVLGLWWRNGRHHNGVFAADVVNCERWLRW